MAQFPGRAFLVAAVIALVTLVHDASAQDCSIRDPNSGECLLQSLEETKAPEQPKTSGYIRRGPLGGVIGVPAGYYVCDLYDWKAKRCIVRATTEEQFRGAVKAGFDAANVMIARQCAIFSPGEECPLAEMPKEFKGPGSQVAVSPPAPTPPPPSAEGINVDPLSTSSGTVEQTAPTSLPANPSATQTQKSTPATKPAGCMPGDQSVLAWSSTPTESSESALALCAITGGCYSGQERMCVVPQVPNVAVAPSQVCVDDLTGAPIVGPHYNVFFINGVNNTRFVALKNLDATAQLVRELQLPLRVCHTALINSSAGLLTDVGEVHTALTGDPAWVFMVDQKLAAYRGEIDDFAATVARELANPDSRGAVIVAHSEGNIFANETFKVLAQKHNIGWRSVQLVGVGVPAPYLVGTTRYTTAKEDAIILALRIDMKMHGITILPPNSELQSVNALQMLLTCGDCHGYIETYTNIDFREVRNQIKGHIEEALRELRHNSQL